MLLIVLIISLIALIISLVFMWKYKAKAKEDSVAYTDLLKSVNVKIDKKENYYINMLEAIVTDLDSYRKVAKGFEVAGIKKALKIIADHYARKV